MHDFKSLQKDNELIIHHLKKSRLFHHIPDIVLQEVLPLSQMCAFSKGTEILKEGQSNQKIYFLITGKVSVFSGSENILTLKRTGDVFGEMSIISNQNCSATVTAMTDIQVITIDAHSIGDYAQVHTKYLQDMLYQVFSMILTEKLNITTHKAQKFEQANHELLLTKTKLQQMHLTLEQRNQELQSEIIENRHAEKKRIKLEQELRQSKKIEALGILAGGIAHDFNNILSAIMANTEMFLMTTPDQTNTLYLEQALQSCHRAADLTQQILTFSRMEAPNTELVDLASLIQEAIEMLRATLPVNIKVQLNIQKDSAYIVANGTQIHQVIVNLCTNAKHAMLQHGGTIEITLKTSHRIPQGMQAKHGCFTLSVKDSGCGIPQETQDKIFDPFFTTKDMGIGTGLGLSVIHGIVKEYKGDICVESQLGIGSIFHISFPAAKQNLQTNQRKPVTLKEAQGHILIIEDDNTLRSLYQNYLKKLGYDVQAYGNSITAIHSFAQQPDYFDLVLINQSLPSMQGNQCVHDIHHIKKNTPILVMTTTANHSPKTQDIDVAQYLMKPISLQQLRSVIANFLS